MTVALTIQIPVATIALPPFVRQGRRAMIGHLEDSVICDEFDVEEAPVVARLTFADTVPLTVRKMEDQFFLEAAGFEPGSRTVQFIPRTPSSVFSDSGVVRMFRDAVKAAGAASDIKSRWAALPAKVLTNLRRMRLRNANEELVKAQMDTWQDFLRPPVLIGGRLYRPCDEPFVELALVDYRPRLNLLVDRDRCSASTYSVHSLNELGRLRSMSALFPCHHVSRDFKVSRVNTEAFSSSFLYRRFAILARVISKGLRWIGPAPGGLLKFAADLTPPRQAALFELDRAIRSDETWTTPPNIDHLLRAMTTLRHDPHFEHAFCVCERRADILIAELDAAPIKFVFGRHDRESMAAAVK